MPEFSDSATTAAPPEEVWKLLYDPTRIPDWWDGIESAELDHDTLTIYPDGYPDFPMPQRITSSRDDGVVRFSCQVSDLRFEWRLAPRDDGGTDIAIDVEIPEQEAHRLDDQRRAVAKSIRNLAELAASVEQ